MIDILSPGSTVEVVHACPGQGFRPSDPIASQMLISKPWKGPHESCTQPRKSHPQCPGELSQLGDTTLGSL